MYHLFYQDHVGIGGGITWGHVVSRNLTTWARVGVGVWNNQPYDSTAIYSGSCVNSVHGRMTLIYPGVCPKGSSPACLFGTTVNLAVPADPLDALSRNFSKLSVNPIAQVNDSVGPGGGGPPGGGGDSSAAWQTASGEWRLLTRDRVFSNVWESSDFANWVQLGPQPGFTQGACPSFFPLPNRTAGAGPPPPGTQDPTHVYLYGVRLIVRGTGRPTYTSTHVYLYVYLTCTSTCTQDTTLLPRSASHRTVLVAGTYTEHGKGKLASFAPTVGVAQGLTPQVSDNGTYYAAKDFWDSKHGRRILWGWAQIPNGAQALARHITWHPQLQQLLFSPLAEQAALRHSPTFPGGPSRLVVGGEAGSTAAIGAWQAGAAKQAEVLATFALPSVGVTFGVRILGLLEAFVKFAPSSSHSGRGSTASPDATGSWEVGVGIRAAGGDTGASLTRFMPNTDLQGGDYNKNASTGRHHPPGTDPKVCQNECDAAEQCVAWTYVIRGAPKGSGDCCLKKMNATGHEASLNLCPHRSSTCTSGVKTPRTEPNCHGGGAAASSYAEATVRLLPMDQDLEIRAFTDHSILGKGPLPIVVAAFLVWICLSA